MRDIRTRVEEFIYKDDEYEANTFTIEPIALSMAQIREYTPPPNPAKITDPRAGEYIKKYGDKSWEVDALKPEVLHALLDSNIRNNMDLELFESALIQEEEGKKKLKNVIQYL